MKAQDLPLFWKILCLIWPVGLLYYFIKIKGQPRQAKQALNQALIGFGVSLVLGIVYSIVAGGM